ncbi:MAG: hypothetical protein JST59_02885 [Actinobacteria bacterium]|nr:hypothetical protein [Actinomycetota bacterium]
MQLQVEHLGRENSSLVQRTNEIDRLNKSTIDLQGSLVKLTREKQEIVEESRNAQETLRQTNLNLQRLMGEHSDVRQKYNLLHQENEQLKNSLATASSEIGRRLGDSENRVLQLSSENDNLKRRLNDANNEWNSKQNGYEQRIASYEQRIAGYDQRIVTYESKISSYEQRITIITR